MSPLNLFHPSYWFTPPYPLYHGARAFAWAVFGVVTVLGVLALVVRALQKDNAIKVVLARIASCGITMGLLGALLFSFRQETIALFSWRVWLLFWLIGLVYWVVCIVRYAIRRVPQIKVENKTREMRERYLPKRS